MKHIIFYLHKMGGGGAERAAALLANQFAKKFEVTILLHDIENSNYLNQLDSKIKIVSVKKDVFYLWIFKVFRTFKKCKKNTEIITVVPIEALVVEIYKFFNNPLSHSYVVQNSYSIQVNSLSIWQQFLLTFLSYIFRSSNHLIAVSKGVREDIINNYNINNRSVHVIYNPVDIVHTNMMSKKPINISKRYIVSVGRLTLQKNFQLLINSFNNIKNDVEQDLIILGEGEQRVEIEKLISTLGLEDRVHLLGYVENPYPYILNSDLFAMTSNWEGMPLALIEAMALGCNIVCTDCISGPKELLDNGKFGKLVPVNDQEEFSKSMFQSLSSSKPNKTMLRTRAELFAAPVIADQFLEILLKE